MRKRNLPRLPVALILITGDFNQLLNRDLQEQTGLMQIVHQPTLGNSYLGLYSWMSVVVSIFKSDHRAVIAFSLYVNDQKQFPGELAVRSRSRWVSMLSSCNTLLLTIHQVDLCGISHSSILISRAYVSLQKSRLDLVRKIGWKVEEAGPFAILIGRDIACQSRTRLGNATGKLAAKDAWSAVRQLAGRRLNYWWSRCWVAHRALCIHFNWSFTLFHLPSQWLLISSNKTEWQVFQVLNRLHSTAMDLDKYLPGLWELVLQFIVTP